MFIKKMFLVCSITLLHCTPIHTMFILGKSLKASYASKISKNMPHYRGSHVLIDPNIVAITIMIPLTIALEISSYSKKNRDINQAYRYITECLQGKHAVIIDDKKLERCDRHEKGRFHLLLQLKEQYEQLCLVENLEKEKWLNCNKEKITELQKIETVFKLIEQQKSNIFSAACALEDAMPRYQSKQEALYAEKLGITRVSPTLKKFISENVISMNALIQELKNKHEKDTIKENALLKYKE